MSRVHGVYSLLLAWMCKIVGRGGIRTRRIPEARWGPSGPQSRRGYLANLRPLVAITAARLAGSPPSA